MCRSQGVLDTQGVAVKDRGGFCRTNAHFTAKDDTLPETDPHRQLFDREDAFVPADNFTVTLALQNADSGGEFEYAPMIWDSQDEQFDDVAAVLHGQ